MSILVDQIFKLLSPAEFAGLLAALGVALYAFAGIGGDDFLDLLDIGGDGDSDGGGDGSD